ncbi:Regulatory protein BlaR1 [Posidoniimonas corsicana]|uniref:Regulatory protein BlaR1 n=1 Tax=Posidoniimonas corsicana TaxID=1938618 RepID=A0A5C5V471_9BACT|nr:M56 family metallopeptidase [Posidoniimonas corsicana]TWT32495.1 Regulatory protein BlaR1 [Posidoniimonas corsicana]
MATPFDGGEFLLGLASRSLVLLALTAAVAYTLRRRSAALLHAVWTVGLAACLAVPVVGWLSPGWQAAVLPARASNAVARSAVPTRAADTPRRGVIAPGTRTIARPPAAPQPALERPQPIVKPTPAAAIAPAPALQGPSLSTLLLAGWTLGLLIVLLRLLAQVAMVRRLTSRAAPLADGEWNQLCDNLCQRLGLRRAVSLATHTAAPGPIVTGLARPVVVLPADAPTWPAERRRQVLLHELAHVRRHDLLTQLMATAACAVYWFNPLAWWAARRMKRLREIACDDAVVTHGGAAPDYAQTLLEIARGYRCRPTAGAVAMAASPQVEGRIAAILSSGRSRAALTARAARALAAAAAIGAAVVATCQLTTRDATANEPESDPPAATAPTEPTQAADDAPPAVDHRTMVVRVLNEDGQPLPGARVYSAIWEMQGEPDFPSRSNAADEQARARIAIPHRLNILRLWPSKEGYVPQFMNFSEGTHEEGRLIPDEYEFRLQKGVTLGGRVVDEAGQPIEGALVQVRVEVDEPAWGRGAKPMISTWLTDSDFNSAPPRTDADGAWSITNAPPPRSNGRDDYEFRLLVTHPDYAGDAEWGGLQREQGVTTQDLRRGDAKLVLASGVAVTGVVTGPDGSPVSEGLVVWHDRPYWATGVNETAIGADGRYQTERLTPGEYPITVLAPGFAPQRKMVTVEHGMGDLDLQLAAGHPIRIHIVNTQGEPVPKAYVGIGEWRGTEAIYNEKHPNVPLSGVPRHADENGVYAWDWAPKDAVGYRISAKGHAGQELTLIAKSEPHVVTLAPRRVVVGEVTDAETGKPIENFQAMPVIVFRPDFYHTRSEDAKLGRDGRYELPLTGSADPNDDYRVRFEAPGYRSLISEESFGPRDGRATLDVRLTPAPAREGRVLDSAGRPVVDAVVLEASPTMVPSTSNGEPESYGSRPVPTEAGGRFSLPATSEPTLVRAYHEKGFAERTLAPDETAIGDLRLAPWAWVSGVLLQDGRPVADQWVYFSPLGQRGLLEPRFQDSYSARTDTLGRFRFDRLPPVSGGLRASLGPWRDSPLSSSESVPLELAPGEHREVQLNGDGATVTGRVVATGRSNDQLSKQWSLNYLVSRDQGLPYPPEEAPLSFDPTGPLQSEWLGQPDFQSWVATRHNYFVKLADDGGLRVHGVPPGEYDLVLQLYEEPAGCLVETIGEKVVPVTVAADGDLDLGDIDVHCRIGPRVGSDMRAFEITDAGGRVRLIDDLQGRHVLLHAWATWCAPCIQSMPSLKAAVEQHEGKPLTVVGLNIDEDADAARAVAAAQGLAWAQNYLGTDSELMRQLAISTAPAYYLIGPDGKLVGSANHWEAIATLLDGEL